MNSQESKTSHDLAPESPGKLFRKAVILAILASLVLPIVFNIASIKVWLHYLKTEKNNTKKALASVYLAREDKKSSN